jgi:hypothetical protein
MNMISNSYDYIVQLLKNGNEISFCGTCTPYGHECFVSMNPDLPQENKNKLENALHEFHLKSQTLCYSWEYQFILAESMLCAEVLWTYSHQYFYSGSDSDLLCKVDNLIVGLLSEYFNLSESEFNEQYYYEIDYTSVNDIDKGTLEIFNCVSGSNNKIPKMLVKKIIKKVLKLCQQEGVQVNEYVCEFDFSTDDVNLEILERWSETIEDFDQLSNDKNTYKEVLLK